MYFLGVILTQDALTAEIVHNGYTGVESLVMDEIMILGVEFAVTGVTLNGESFERWTQDSETGVSQSLHILEEFNLKNFFCKLRCKGFFRIDKLKVSI